MVGDEDALSSVSGMKSLQDGTNNKDLLPCLDLVGAHRRRRVLVHLLFGQKRLTGR